MPSPPTASKTSSLISDRVGETIRTALEGALDRERVRVHSLYMARQEALLKALAALLRDRLAPHIAAAAATEAAALADAVRKLPAATLADDVLLPAEADVCDAFHKAFEAHMLGAMEKSVNAMLECVASVVDGEVEARIAAPLGDTVVTTLRQAADSVRADRDEFAVVAEKAREAGEGLLIVAPVDPEDGLVSEVARALDEGRVRDALEAGMRGGAGVRAKALSGALDSGVVPEEVLGEWAVGKAEFATVIAVLASDMSDRTGVRLAWLMEATMNLEDAPQSEGDSVQRCLETAIVKLKDMALEGDVTPADIKQAKMLIRCFKIFVKSLKG